MVTTLQKVKQGVRDDFQVRQVIPITSPEHAFLVVCGMFLKFGVLTLRSTILSIMWNTTVFTVCLTILSRVCCTTFSTVAPPHHPRCESASMYDCSSIPPPCSYLIKVTFVTCEKSVVQFDSIKHRRFSPDTPVSSCSNTGPMRGGPY